MKYACVVGDKPTWKDTQIVQVSVEQLKRAEVDNKLTCAQAVEAILAKLKDEGSLKDLGAVTPDKIKAVRDIAVQFRNAVLA